MKKKQAMKTKVNKKGLKCHVCNKSGFVNSYKLNAHLYLHKAIPPRFKCAYCVKEYFRSDEFSRHVATHTKKQKHYYCDHCGRSFVDKRNLISHLYIHDDLPRLAKLRYTCEACGVTYCEERLLKYHIRKQHLNLGTNVPVHLSKKLNDTWIENVKNGENCVQITKIRANTLMIKQCKVKCKKNVKTEKNIFQQYIASVYAIKDNNYSKAICDYCGKVMLKKSIVTHIRERHLKLRKFNCNVCNKWFNRHYQLCLHICGQEDGRKRKRKSRNVLKNSDNDSLNHSTERAEV